MDKNLVYCILTAFFCGGALSTAFFAVGWGISTPQYWIGNFPLCIIAGMCIGRFFRERRDRELQDER